MNKRKSFIIILASLVIVGGIIIFKNIKDTVDSKSVTTHTETETDLGIPVKLENVSKGDIVESINYIGTIEPKKSTTISPTIAGQIVEVYVEEGVKVKAGDLLVKIDDSQLDASLKTSQKKLETLKTNYNYLVDKVDEFYDSNPLIKKLENAQSNYEFLKEERDKHEKLYDEGAISKSAYDKIQQETDTARLQFEELEATIDDKYNQLVHEKDMAEKQIEELNSSINELNNKIGDTLIKAPIDGVVKMVEGNVGDLAAVGKPLVAIDNNEEIIVKINVPESDISKMSIGSKALLGMNGVDDEITAEVSKVIPNINPNTRIGMVEIGPIKNEKPDLLFSGNSTNTRIVTNEVKDKLIIPKNSIKKLKGKDVVYLYKDGVVKEVEIETGITVGENTEVVSGLKEGDKIAVTNLSKLLDGAKVYAFKGEDK
ncbi:efflux RND transporter periplasmic adaptor subunit [Schnuerera sp. xch1]|uniref:efflux RND transporter periplasmic adaptor subunit n=1 Tax=Schnuerera sp. xch1 TaxID=2874283 RepID=UPI001CC05D79|nr:efflux RND transporter periplasmic adaptor subunit [Schnuerera sp. xch1]MBZ2175129.1 efflux RND transporter periplasmic adaptor subunit [Schnuerera sp. xch1]